MSSPPIRELGRRRGRRQHGTTITINGHTYRTGDRFGVPCEEALMRRATVAARDRLASLVVVPGDAGWDEARQAWTRSVEQLPAAVALPESTEDIVEVVRFTRANGLRIAPHDLVLEALAPWCVDTRYLNFVDSRADASTLFPADTLERVRRVKAHYDVEDVIRSNHPILPA